MTRLLAQADAAALPLADKSVSLTFCSPPYMTARTYGIGAQRGCEDWITWMLTVIAECVRVTDGLVLVNCAGVTKDWCYLPGVEGLLYRWWQQGGICWRPAFWHRVGIPGSGGKQWFRADVEYVLAFVGKRGPIPFADNVANGHPPKWGPGGEMSNRTAGGQRINGDTHSVWGRTGHGGTMTADGTRDHRPRPSHRFGGGGTSFGRKPNGEKIAPAGQKLITRRSSNGQRDRKIIPVTHEGMHNQDQFYQEPVKANPGNLLKIIVGGGVMGHPLSHENEAPFPVDLPAWFIRSHSPPGGIVLDPFMGSGSTGQAAWQEGRKFVGFDLRMSQCELSRRRLSTPYAKRVKPPKAKAEEMLFG